MIALSAGQKISLKGDFPADLEINAFISYWRHEGGFRSPRSKAIPLVWDAEEKDILAGPDSGIIEIKRLDIFIKDNIEPVGQIERRFLLYFHDRGGDALPINEIVAQLTEGGELAATFQIWPSTWPGG